MNIIVFFVFYVNKATHDKLQALLSSEFKNPLEISFIGECEDTSQTYEYQINYLTIPRMEVGEKIYLVDTGVNLEITNISYFYLENAPHESYFMYECKCFSN